MLDGEEQYAIRHYSTDTETPKEVEVSFRHPNREILKNQLGLFLIEVLIEQPITVTDSFINRKVEQFMRILDGKAGF